MHVELVRTMTADGLRLDGALQRPAVPLSAGLPVDVLVCLHGVGGNFYSGNLFEHFAPRLLELGIAVLFVNTRGRDGHYVAHTSLGPRYLGAAFETVEECRHDLAAWIAACQKLSLPRVGLLGHSLGGIKCLYSQAHAPDPRVTRVAVYSPPCLSCARFRAGLESASHFESLAAAEQAVAAGRGNDLLRVRFPFPLAISAASYVDKYGPAERYNLLHFGHLVPAPTLWVYGGLELENGGSPFAGLAEAVERLPPSGGPREVHVVPGANHHYTGLQAQAAELLTKWLRR